MPTNAQRNHHGARKMKTFILFLLAVAVLPVSVVAAQEAGNFGVEGHVFDAKTHQPLANATVELSMFVPAGQSALQVVTNIAGLYFMEAAANPTVVTSRITATCHMRGRDIQVTEFFYIPQPNIV